VSDQMNYEAPRPNPGQLTVTIPLSYFNLLVESYYAGRGHNEPPAPVAPQAEETDLAFINKNMGSVDLLEDMPPGWTKVMRKAKPDGK